MVNYAIIVVSTMFCREQDDTAAAKAAAAAAAQEVMEEIGEYYYNLIINKILSSALKKQLFKFSKCVSKPLEAAVGKEETPPVDTLSQPPEYFFR
jgi:hypothetical protein